MSADEPHHAGFCAIVGLPNVGKSTLLNRVLDRHLVAVSPKPQTTRDRIVGVHTLPNAQIAYVDTPGVQNGHGPLRRYMRDAAIAAAQDADVVLLLVDATDRRGRTPERHAEADALALSESSKKHPIIIGLNKVDRVGKPDLLPVMELWGSFAPGVEVVPFSAMTGENVDTLERVIASKLPAGPALFPAEHVTDRSPQFIAQEIIREQLYHQLGKELPYACAVKVETWTEKGTKELIVEALIVVERQSQKAIVVGRAGTRIRELGIAAREALTDAFKKTVHLKLLVKVVDEWSRAERTLEDLGYAGGPQR